MTDTDGPAIDPDAHVNFDAPASLRKWASLNNQRRTEGSGPQAIVYNEHITHNGPTVFEHACRLGLEGIVSKALDASKGSVHGLAEVPQKSPERSGTTRT